MASEVGCGLDQSLWVIAKRAKAEVATNAQQGSDMTGCMAMVYDKTSHFRLSANRAEKIL